MLVVTRRPGEEILIDGDIRIEVVAVKGGRVRLAITAPPYVSVVRQELRDPLPDAGTERDGQPWIVAVRKEPGGHNGHTHNGEQRRF